MSGQRHECGRVRCPECASRSTAKYLHLHGVCHDCKRDRGPRELRGAERDAVIAEFVAWLAGRMPSEIYRRERRLRPRVALDAFVARTKWGRTRPEARVCRST